MCSQEQDMPGTPIASLEDKTKRARPTKRSNKELIFIFENDDGEQHSVSASALCSARFIKS